MGHIYRGIDFRNPNINLSGEMTMEGLLSQIAPLLPFVGNAEVRGRWQGAYKSNYLVEW
jgi:hypothetical protein